jgi:ketosteroid isomerase-like protein
MCERAREHESREHDHGDEEDRHAHGTAETLRSRRGPIRRLRDTRRPMSEEYTTPALVELVRRFHEAWRERDPDTASALLAPDFVYRPIATFPDSQERLGADDFRRFMSDWWDIWAQGANWQLDTVRGYGEAPVALLRFSGRARAGGVETVGGVFEVFRFQDGRIRQIADFTNSEDAIAAAEGPG